MILTKVQSFNFYVLGSDIEVEIGCMKNQCRGNMSSDCRLIIQEKYTLMNIALVDIIIIQIQFH